MKTMMKIPLVLEPQKEGGWTITSPLVPEFVTSQSKSRRCRGSGMV
jgi:antitoxin HicB